MAIFILTRDESLQPAVARLEKRLTADGFNKTQTIIGEGYRLLFLQKLTYDQQPDNSLGRQFIQIDNEQFIGCVGSFFFAGMVGVPALKACFAAFDGQSLDWQNSLGQFSLIIKKAGKIFLATDNLGANKIYYNNEKTIFSNAFQVLFDLIPSGDMDVQGCYEYAWNGATFGEKTFIRQIRSLPFDQTVEIGNKVSFVKRENLVDWQATRQTLNFEDTAQLHVARLRRLFATYGNCFGEKINTALSGGYDSRLILALFMDVGIVPSLFVYGYDGHPDVETARTIATGEGLPLKVVDKNMHPDKKNRMQKIAPDAFAEHIDKNWTLFDGWKPDGIFDSGTDIADRLSRSRSHLVVNGGLGEIYRNFFYLPDRNLTSKQLIWAFFSRYNPKSATKEFSAAKYRLALESAIDCALGSGLHWQHRGRTEMVYPLVRGRYWTAREATINSRIGWSAFPFLEPTIIKDTWNIPLEFKDYGRLEARMIEILNPRLAAYKSVYGHGFSTRPSLKYRLANWSSCQRPIWLRGYLYRIKFAKKAPFPFFMHENYLGEVLDLSFPRMRKYFNMDLINEPKLFNRIATMEYALSRRGWA